MVAQNDYEIQAGYVTKSVDRLLDFMEAAFHNDLMNQLFNENVFFGIGWAWGGYGGRWRGDRNGLVEHIDDSPDLFRVWEILFRPRHVFALEQGEQINIDEENIDTIWYGTYNIHISGSTLTNPQNLAYNVEILNGVMALTIGLASAQSIDLLIENINEMLHNHWKFAKEAGFDWVFDQDWTMLVDNPDAITIRSQIDLLQAFRVYLEAD